MRNKIIIAAIALVVIVAAVLAIVLRKKSPAPANDQGQAQQAVWETYQSQTFHLQIDYPDYWKPSEDAAGLSLASITPVAAPDTYPVGGSVTISYATIFGFDIASTTLDTVKAVYPSGTAETINGLPVYKVQMADQDGTGIAQIYIQMPSGRVLLMKTQASGANTSQSQAIIDRMVGSLKASQ